MLNKTMCYYCGELIEQLKVSLASNAYQERTRCTIAEASTLRMAHTQCGMRLFGPLWSPNLSGWVFGTMLKDIICRAPDKRAPPAVLRRKVALTTKRMRHQWREDQSIRNSLTEYGGEYNKHWVVYKLVDRTCYKPRISFQLYNKISQKRFYNLHDAREHAKELMLASLVCVEM